jgi:hypothetical protein
MLHCISNEQIDPDIPTRHVESRLFGIGRSQFIDQVADFLF